MLLERLLESGSKEDVIISINTFTFILSCHTNTCLPTKWSKIETIDLYFVPLTTDNEQKHERSMTHSHFMSYLIACQVINVFPFALIHLKWSFNSPAASVDYDILNNVCTSVYFCQRPFSFNHDSVFPNMSHSPLTSDTV